MVNIGLKKEMSDDVKNKKILTKIYILCNIIYFFLDIETYNMINSKSKQH